MIAIMFSVLGAWGNVQAQGCLDLLEPYFKFNNTNPEDYPQEKLEWRCRYVRAAFYMTNTIPENVPLYEISEVTDVFTGSHMSENEVIDIETLSYYQYDFARFQHMNDKVTVYFRLRHGKYKYLALRPVIEMLDRASFPENYYKN